MHLIGLPGEPPHSVVGTGLQFGGDIDEVRYCVSGSVVCITCDKQGRFVINFTLPGTWLQYLIDALEDNELQFAGYTLVESLEQLESRIDEHGELVGLPMPDRKIYYYTINGAYPRSIQALEAFRDDIKFVATGGQKEE